MAVSWFLCPVKLDSFDGELFRACAIFDDQDDILKDGGAWAQSEIDGGQSLVRVRAGVPLLNSLALKYPELSDAEAHQAWAPVRAKPKFASGKSGIIFDAVQKIPAMATLADLVKQVPAVAPSPAVTQLLLAWLAVGFGLGWRIPYALALTLALNGVEPDRWGRVGFPELLQSVPYAQRYAFPTTAVLDDFNRADETPLSQSGAWTTAVISGHATLALGANQCVGSTGGANSSYRTTILGGADAEAFVTLATHGSSHDFAVCNRIASPGSAGAVDGYRGQMQLGSTLRVRIQRLDNDVRTTIASVNQTIVSGDSVGLESIGSTIAAYFKVGAGAWNQVVSVSDATYGAAGYLALQQDATFNVSDNFGGGVIAAAAASLLLRGNPMAALLAM